MWTIGLLAQRFGLSRSTLLYYDKISLLSPTGGRSSANYRIYSEADRQRLQRICSLREASLSLETIKKILASESDTLEMALEERLGQLNKEIRQLRTQQKVIVHLLYVPEFSQGSRIMDKQKWVTLLKSVGMDETDMRNWHVSFEKMMPEAQKPVELSLSWRSTEIMKMTIRPASSDDFDQLWPILREVFQSGETYAFDPEITGPETRKVWLEIPAATYLFEQDGRILGSYYLKPNQPGLGSHVCNAGYVVAGHARRQGIARKLCEHSIQEARRLGFLAMQFNLVASTNKGAIQLWKEMGFEVVGTLPKAFNHQSMGLVDALVMYQWIA